MHNRHFSYLNPGLFLRTYYYYYTENPTNSLKALLFIMIKNVLFLIFISFHLGKCKNVTVEYDEEKQIILFEGKIFTLINKQDLSSFKPTIFNEKSAHGGEEAELTEAQFWTYVFVSLCKT